MLFRWLRPSLLQALPPHRSCRFWRKSPLGPFFYHDPGSFLLDLLIRDFLIAMGASHPCTQAKFVSDACMLADYRFAFSPPDVCVVQQSHARASQPDRGQLSVRCALHEASAGEIRSPKENRGKFRC